MLIAAIVAAIAVAAGVAAGGGADVFAQIFKDWKKWLRKYVKDEEKRAQAEEILERFRDDVHDLHEGVSKNVNALGDVHRTYASTMDQYQVHIDRLAADMLTSQVDMLDIAIEIQEVLGPETYGKIAAEVRKEADKRDKKLGKADAKRDKKEAKEKAKAAK